MDSMLEFARGPMFRISFALMVLGLLRVFILDIWGMVEALMKAGDKTFPWGQAFGKTIAWLIPVKKVGSKRPIYSIISIIFHIGMLIVPIFLFAHVGLWKNGLGISWITLNKEWADLLTIITIIAGLALFIGRVAVSESRFISRKQDFLWPLLIIIPFITGGICAILTISPAAYQILMLIHILSANLIFILMPFTKIAHCILMPLSQFVMVIAWRFPANTDDAVCTTLNKKGAPV